MAQRVLTPTSRLKNNNDEVQAVSRGFSSSTLEKWDLDMSDGEYKVVMGMDGDGNSKSIFFHDKRETTKQLSRYMNDDKERLFARLDEKS
jgi:hypothetical protein